YPTFSLPLSHFFLPFPHPHPDISCPFIPPYSRISLPLIPPIPDFSSSSPFFSPQTVKPHLDTLSCPTHQNWTEGQEETLKCRAGGRPRPQIVCSKDGDPLDTESSHRAHRDHAGVYRCRATNELGTVERNVTIWVTC
ncbi:ICAM5 protein, partial [Sterrhoptilus dennistouni]|nr:ICAM5 protein [Sterrhoptilus dennistouni]